MILRQVKLNNSMVVYIMMVKFTDLINGSNTEAIQILQDEYNRTGDLPILFNLDLILLDNGSWQRVKDNCEVIIKKSKDSHELDFIISGMAEWFMGNQISGVNFWMQSMDTEYADLAGAINGPLNIWYAGCRLKDDKLIKLSLRKLKSFWKVTDCRKIVKWPGTQAIAGFLLDQIPQEDFLVKWKWDGSEVLEVRRLCRAHFWVGMKLLDQNQEQAIKHFKAAYSADKRAILEYEYFLAKWEYARLTGQNLWDNNQR